MNSELFAVDAQANLLPGDGMVNYHGPILSPSDAQAYFVALRDQVPWAHDEAVIFGKRIVTARQVAWYGDARYAYTYSGTTKQALLWNAPLFTLKALVEKASGAKFNSCLLNFYHDGNQGMSWHSDDEKMLERHGVIASLSLGAERKFAFKHKRTGLSVSIVLESGSLLVMKGETQTHWLHQLPKAKSVLQPRINLTFRTMVEIGQPRSNL